MPERTEIDPTARILGDVVLADPARVKAFAVVEGPVRAGPGLRVASFASLGGDAQHRVGTEGRLEIGADGRFSEFCSVHRGSPAGTGVTRIGDRAFVMAYAHIGHDAELADDVTVSNQCQIGGHVTIGARAVLGAGAAIHQFVRIGTGAMIAAGAFVTGDVPPWTLASGDRARLLGPNEPGLRLAFGPGHGARVRKALRLLLDGEPLEALGPWPGRDPAGDIAAFLAEPSRRRLAPRGWR